MDGELKFGTKIDTSGVKSGMSNIGSIAQKGLGVAEKATKALAVGLGAATTAAGALTKMAVSGYADYEQLTGGVETLFKTSSGTVMNYANNAYKTAGLSANGYMDTITGFSASLLQGLGGDTEKAAQIGNMAVTDMADNANKMGTGIENIQNAYQGFAKQNYTMLDNLKLGYGGTKEEMERLLKDAEKLTGVHYDINNFSDVISAIHAVQDEMGVTGTTAKEASTTISGSVDSAKAAWSNLLTGMADDNADFDTLVSNFVDSVGTAASNILPRVEIAINGVGKLIEELLPVAINEIPKIIDDVLPGLVSAGAGMLAAIGQGILDNLPVLSDTVASMIDGLDKFLYDNQETLTGTVTEIATAVLGSVLNLLPSVIALGEQLIVNICDGLSTALPQLLDQVITIIPTIVNSFVTNFPTVIQAGCDLLVNLTNGILSAIPTMIAMLPQIIISIVNTLLASIPTIIQCGITLLTSLTNALPDIINQIVAVLPQIIDGIVTSLFNNLPAIVSAGFQLLVALVQDLPQIILAIVAAIPQIIGGILGKLGEHVSDIASKGVELLGSLITNLPEIITNIVSSIPDIITAIVGAFGNGVTDMADVGGNLIKGLWNGISDSVTWLYNQISGFANGVLDKVKGLFGIHSPSKKFKWIGKMCMEGFDEPIADYNPYDTLQKSFKANKDTLAADFIGGTSTVNNNSSNQTVIIQQPVRSPSETARAIRRNAQEGLVG